MAPCLRPLARLRPPGMLLRALQLLLLLGSGPGVWCFSELFFIKEPQDVTVTRKDPVILDCQAHGEVPIKVTWLKNGAKVSENKRIQVLSNGSLYISEAEGKRGEQSDEGFYQCLAMNKYGAILSQKAHLTLSTISAFEVQPISTEVQEGGVARFACKISSNPPAVITWELNRTTLPVTMDRITALPTGVLQIYDVGHRDAGNYRCVAATVAHRRKSMEASLTVIPGTVPAVSFSSVAIIVWYNAVNCAREELWIFLCIHFCWLFLAPKSPELHLEPLNCTTISVKWQQDAEDTATIQGYKLYYKEEGQQEHGPIFLDTGDLLYTLSGLDPRRKYHVRLLAYNNVEDGYQADQTVSTPGCVSVRDRMVPPPPPPHHLYAKANSSSSIFLHWRRPAFTTAQIINYTIRCNPVGLQNASLVLYLQTSETHMLVQGLEPNTKYEFAVRLHVDQLSSPWSPVVYHSTLPEAPAGPPIGVKVTLIEDDTALVSWKPPDGPETVVTRYTILYASRKAWIAGEWQVLHREGKYEHKLSKRMKSKIIDGKETNRKKDLEPHLVHSSRSPMKLEDFLFLGYFRKSSASKTAQNGTPQLPRTSTSLAGGSEAGKNLGGAGENEESLMPMIMPNSFIDAKGGTDLIINSYGPIIKNNSKKKWLFFQDSKKIKVEQPQRRFAQAVCFYQPGTTVLISDEDSPSSPGQRASFPRPFGGVAADTEHSANSEGSHETGDSGRFSHESNDEIHLSSVISTTPPTSSSFTGSESGGDPSLRKREDPAVPLDAEQTSSSVLQLPSAMLLFDKNDFPI
nr:protogenin [Mirounga angustirostris]